MDAAVFSVRNTVSIDDKPVYNANRAYRVFASTVREMCTMVQLMIIVGPSGVSDLTGETVTTRTDAQ